VNILNAKNRKMQYIQRNFSVFCVIKIYKHPACYLSNCLKYIFSWWSTGEWFNLDAGCFAPNVRINGACLAPNGIFLGWKVWPQYWGFPCFRPVEAEMETTMAVILDGIASVFHLLASLTSTMRGRTHQISLHHIIYRPRYRGFHVFNMWKLLWKRQWWYF
jgi:hypothetical protein